VGTQSFTAGSTFTVMVNLVDQFFNRSLTENTFVQTITDILQNILVANANRIIIINTGISTIKPLESMLDEINQKQQITLFNIYSGTNFTEAVKTLEKQTTGGHADEIETSIMLSLASEKVNMSKAKKFNGELTAGPLNPDNPGEPNYSPYGIIGDATLATIEKGEKLTQAILKDLAKVITVNNWQQV